MYDLVLLNANVITMDPSMPRARLVGVRGGRIVEVSKEGRVDTTDALGTKTIDCGGRTVLPGFIDAHCHVAAYAQSLAVLGLSPRDNIDSIAGIQDRISEACQGRAPGAWVRGRGYDEFSLSEQRHPDRRDLDAAAPLHPVKLTHRSGHAHVLNSLALKEVGITAETGDPPGGLIDRHARTGEPTGILFGMGGYLARRAPPLDDREMEEGLSLASRKLLSFGITSVQDASAHNDLRKWRRFGDWIGRALFTPRVTMMMGLKGFLAWQEQAYPPFVERDRLKVGGVKIVATETTGSLYPDQKTLGENLQAIHASGLQAVVHAVEEPVIEAACLAIEHAQTAHPPRDHRHRIEHCSVCPPSLVKRIRDQGIIVVTQPSFIYYNGDRYLSTVPERQQRYLYPIGSLAARGVPVAFSSDFPVSEPNPLAGVYAAAFRQTKAGRSVLPEEGVGMFEALRMYTLSAAESAFEEKEKGSIALGRLADLVVLGEDPFEADAARVKDIPVEMTIMNGEVVWSLETPTLRTTR